jgi:hypothetical protein
MLILSSGVHTLTRPNQALVGMRSWDLKRANRDHGLQRLLQRLLCVKPDDIVVLLVVAGEQPSGCEIRRSLPEEQGPPPRSPQVSARTRPSRSARSTMVPRTAARRRASSASPRALDPKRITRESGGAARCVRGSLR